MHSTSLENMQKCYEKYICSDYFSTLEKLSVLDIGGADVNGSYRNIFSSEKFAYVAADIEDSEFVDIVLEDPYCFPIPDGAFDVVISGQTLEHSEKFWLVFQEMARVVKEDGWVILIVPSAGPIHRYPVDCYRFYPDSLKALARETQLTVVDLYIDDRGQWKDLVGVFSKTEDCSARRNDSWRPLRGGQKNLYSLTYQQITGPFPNMTGETEATKGSIPRYELIEMIHEWAQPSLYLEIGVGKGKSLELAKSDSIAIDPQPKCSASDFPKTEFHQMPSDYYFDHFWPQGKRDAHIDLAFIDGMHLFENVLRDFMNIERRSSDHTVVLVDDIFPNHPMQAERVRATSKWTGDVWKFLVCLLELRPDLEVTMFDAQPTGLLMIRGLDSSNRILTTWYDHIRGRYRNLKLADYQQLILDRQQSVSLPLDKFPEFFLALDERRDRSIPTPTTITDSDFKLVRENAYKIAAMAAQSERAAARAAELERDNAKLRQAVTAYTSSASWRLTSPLRKILSLVSPPR